MNYSYRMTVSLGLDQSVFIVRRGDFCLGRGSRFLDCQDVHSYARWRLEMVSKTTSDAGKWGLQVRWTRPLFITLAASLLVMACSPATSSTPTVTSAAPSATATLTLGATPTAAGTPTVATTTSSLGIILVDASGRTLYMHVSDENNKSSCTGACAQAWPPVQPTGGLVAGTGLRMQLLSTITRDDASSQVAYNSHALYYFVRDTKPGDATGQGINAFGGVWLVLSSTGEPIPAAAPAP
jgi:predicted lipoprotein with Yx(FWY)xxD motif